MALTATEQRLVERILRNGDRWRDRFQVFADMVAGELSDVFGEFVRTKGGLLLSAVNALELDENGVIANNSANRGRLLRMLRDVQQYQLEVYGPAGPLESVARPRLEEAARRGVYKAVDTVKLAEPHMAPGASYTAEASMALVDDARGIMFDAMHARNEMDLDVLRREFVRSLIDPQGTPEGLRTALERTGQIDGMLDSAGRRITASERADRIAKYEFGKLAEDSHDAAWDEFYYDGEPPPLEQRWFLWHTNLDGREQESHRRRHGHILNAKQWNERDWGDGRYGGPPLRPRCRCTRSRVMPHWFSEDSQREIFGADEQGGTMPGMAEVDTGKRRVQ